MLSSGHAVFMLVAFFTDHAVSDLGFTELRMTLFENSSQECTPVLVIDDDDVEGIESTRLVLTKRENIDLAELTLMQRENIGLEVVFNPRFTTLIILDNDLPTPSPSPSPSPSLSPSPSPSPTCKNNLHANFALLIKTDSVVIYKKYLTNLLQFISVEMSLSTNLYQHQSIARPLFHKGIRCLELFPHVGIKRI